MFKWKSEYVYLSRFLSSGVLNTATGFSIIFLLMAFGVSPFLANICGYLAGFALGFAVSKKFVFRSNEHFLGESIRYLTAFICCFMINLLVLSLAVKAFNFGAVLAQILAAISYTLSMYVSTRHFVFSDSSNLKNN